MVSYFQSTRPDLSLMSPSHCIKNALWVNKCTHRVTMKRPESEIFSVLEKVHIFSAAFSAPCSPRKTAVRETEGYSWCFPSIYVEHELVVPSGLALVGVCIFCMETIWRHFSFRQFSECRLIIWTITCPYHFIPLPEHLCLCWNFYSLTMCPNTVL